MTNFIKLLVLLASMLGFNAVRPIADLEIVSMETNDPGHMFKEFATSSQPYAIKFREFAKKAYGIDFTGPPPPLNENIVDWRQK
jgi:hypothetical protein